MLKRTEKELLIAACRSTGLSPDQIIGVLAVADGRAPRSNTCTLPLLVNQASAAKMISGSRFLIRRLVKDGKLRQVFLTPDCVRYSREELEKLAAGTL